MNGRCIETQFNTHLKVESYVNFFHFFTQGIPKVRLLVNKKRTKKKETFHTQMNMRCHDKISCFVISDIYFVLEWTSTRLMRLNLDKCNFGKYNPKTNYTMKSYDNEQQIQIEKTESERDLGIQVQANLKYDAQVSKSTSKANSMLGMLKRTFVQTSGKNYIQHT